MTADEVLALNPKAIILSPGPCYPKEAGVCEQVVNELSGDQPILGVCLGHQAICAVFGATITYARQLMHGKQSEVRLDTECPLFVGCPERTAVARYHSLVAEKNTVPDCLHVTAQTDSGEIMAVEHTQYPVFGVQFHPESIMTPYGKTMLLNFIRGYRKDK